MRSATLLVPFAAFVLPDVHAAQGPSPGFTLYGTTQSSDTLLRDESGTTMKTWSADDPPGLSVYMLPSGNLLRTAHPPDAAFGSGAGGRVEELDWNGNSVWRYDYYNADVLAHHDVEPMPNGNVLMIAWENVLPVDAIQMGRNPSTLSSIFQPDHIIEVQPTGPTTGDIVWEWHATDHLVQDFDATKDNFGVVADHPELIDVNYPPGNAGDWMHVNSVDYNPELDQILISVNFFDEIWVIDHSTTTEEAAGHTGGNSGKGGDILYRWGNPQAYDAGTVSDQILRRQHDANWVEPGYPGEGNIVLFNNIAGGSGGPFGDSYSSVVEIETPVDGSGNYALVPGTAYGPIAPVWEYTAPVPTDFFNSIMGGAVRLANGNTLVCSSTQFWMFEVDPLGNTVWELTGVGQVFKARRYERTLWLDGEGFSVASGGSVELELLTGSEHASRFFFGLGSVSGTTPGVPIHGHVIPLNPFDPYFSISVAGGAPLSPQFGGLDLSGRGSSTFSLAPAGPALAGLDVHHAFVVIDPSTLLVEHATNAVGFELLP